MAKITTVLQTTNVKKTVKKLHQNQKRDLNTAEKALMGAPPLGEQKKGDLAFLCVSEFSE